LRGALKRGARLVTIGGVMSALNLLRLPPSLRCKVTVLKGAPHILGRVAGPEIATYFRDLHARHDEKLKTSAAVQDVTAGEKAPTIVTCREGNQYPADVVVGAIGILPNVGLAEAAELDCDDGIIIDEDARTSTRTFGPRRLHAAL
jgi:3-phenylpropionate/trans-cinnamate dioxygenase ferredoxin reductase subunit